MSKLYEIWGKHRAKYQGLINSKVANDLTTLMGKVFLNNKKTSVTGKIKINPDKDTGALTGITDLAITHNVNPTHTYSLLHSGTKTTINGDIPLYKKDKHSLGLIGLANCNIDEKEESCSLSALVKYYYGNCTNLMVGIDGYDHVKGERPNILSVHCAHGRNLANGINVYGAIIAGYLLKEKQLKYQRTVIAGRNSFFDVMLEYNIDKIEQSISDVSMSTENPSVNFKKTIGLAIVTNLSPHLTVGGDTEFKIDNHILTNRLFTNFQLSNETMLKTKWEDTDKSVTLSLSHCFRGLLTLGMTGKFNMVKNGNDSCKCLLPKIRSKLGFSLEILDSFI